MYALKRFFALALSTATALGMLACVRGTNLLKFSALDGARTFYLDSASSQGLRTETLEFSDLARVRGESVRLSAETTETLGDSAAEIAGAIAAKYGATVLIEESACGVTSFYAYTPAWGDTVCVAGKTVNLHIAVSETACAVGSPIIFGGF
ncbi:MAG: YwmB family TATA-box binding protein [Clostridia bacterium]|nr:YwmB family TATA-box binding protein [Clostridia bacterium]